MSLDQLQRKIEHIVARMGHCLVRFSGGAANIESVGTSSIEVTGDRRHAFPAGLNFEVEEIEERYEIASTDYDSALAVTTVHTTGSLSGNVTTGQTAQVDFVTLGSLEGLSYTWSHNQTNKNTAGAESPLSTDYEATAVMQQTSEVEIAAAAGIPQHEIDILLAPKGQPNTVAKLDAVDAAEDGLLVYNTLGQIAGDLDMSSEGGSTITLTVPFHVSKDFSEVVK